MKHRRKTFLGVLFLLIALVSMVFTIGAAGSDTDPLISKSYLDTKMNELKSYIDSKTSSNSGSASTFTPILVPAKATLLGGEGTELILRSGAATAIEFDKNGIADVTAGKDLRQGIAVPKNHLILIPKEDGRGIKISNSEDAWVMVKGTYTVK